MLDKVLWNLHYFMGIYWLYVKWAFVLHSLTFFETEKLCSTALVLVLALKLLEVTWKKTMFGDGTLVTVLCLLCYQHEANVEKTWWNVNVLRKRLQIERRWPFVWRSSSLISFPSRRFHSWYSVGISRLLWRQWGNAQVEATKEEIQSTSKILFFFWQTDNGEERVDYSQWKVR